MKKNLRRSLSMFLAVVMLFSLSLTAFAAEDIAPKADFEPFTPEVDVLPEYSAGDGELEEVDPGTLNVKKLGDDPALAGEENTLTAETLPHGLDDVVRVSIFLAKPGALDAGYSAQGIGTNRGAASYRDSLRAQQRSIASSIEAATGSALDVKWNLTLAVNAISANVRYGDIDTIKLIPGVRAVELENHYEPQRDEINTSITTKEMVFATNAWAEGYTGAGSLVAIIDTGTNQNHASFDPDAFEYAIFQTGKDVDLLTEADVAAVAGQLNAPINAGQAYKNSKIPYAYNYIDGGYTTDHYSDSQGEHGSHVSGIAAANRFVEVDGEFVDAISSTYAVGVAPDAQILTMKVFGKGGGAYDSDYMAAIEDAVVLGADACNLSLGSASPGFTFAGEYQAVMDSLVNSGTVVSISAGNSYYWNAFGETDYYGDLLISDDVSFHTGGSPGTYINSLCVASADNVGVIGTPLVFNGSQAVFFNETDSSGARMSSIAGEYDYVYIYGVGEADEYAAVNEVVPLAGKVLITNRGTLSFYEKGNNAIKFNPAALVVANNQAGTINMALDNYVGTFPMVSITRADADAIIRASEGGMAGNYYYFTGTMKVTDTVASFVNNELADAEVSSFSSWGTPGSLTMKPEIVAPGGDIWSVNGMTDTEYEIMGGTSMAAPHVAGMAGVLGQYVDETDLAARTGVNKRTLINSLLMSTAVPMQPGGSYLSILQQGAGLGNVAAAAQAKSFILMADDANTGAADGKVKVELGQDAQREGAYSFAFTLTNFSDQPLAYELNTDMFTQALEYSGMVLSRNTTPVAASVSYYWLKDEVTGVDVDKNGTTNTDDAQAILDYLTGEADGAALDLAAADYDGDGSVTTNDAYMLLDWLKQAGIAGSDCVLLRGGESKTVTVSIQLTDGSLDNYPVGAYIEGYTYVTCITETEDGAFEDVQHSIPILGFYGSWTESSMFDKMSLIGQLYDYDWDPYFVGRTGNNANSFLIRYDGKSATAFTGNPYMVEEEIPFDRMAVNSSSVISAIKYNLLRNAGTVCWIAFDEEGEILDSGAYENEVIGPFYHVNEGKWYNTGTTTAKINTRVSDFGVKEGDTFTLAMFAVPELYAMILDPGTKSGAVSEQEILDLMASGEMGQGAMFGYTFTVDDKVPAVTVDVNEDKTLVTVTASDDNYVAYVAAMDPGASTAYLESVPEQTQPGETVTVEIPVTEEMGNAFVVFVADYAGNERAYLVRVKDGPVTTKVTEEFYQLTDTLEAGKEYVIVNTDAAGNGYALSSAGTNYYTIVANVTVMEDDERGVYIPAENVAEESVWISAGGQGSFTFANSSDGGVLGCNDFDLPYVCWANPGYADSFVYEDDMLLYAPYASDGYGMYFNGANFMFGMAAPVYLFEKTAIVTETEIDPDNANSVTVTPAENLLILDVIPTAELRAEVQPIFLDDLSVTWSSSDETVATVDANGLVTAVGVGEAVITAASNKTPDVVGTATVTVIDKTPMDSYVYGQVAFGKDDIQFAAIDLNDMSVYKLGEAFSAFYGGAQAGSYIYGNDSDNDFHRFQITEDGEIVYDGNFSFSIVPNYALLDGANIPSWTMTVDGEDYLYDYAVAAVSPAGYLEFLTEDKSLSYFDLNELGHMVAICFAGADQEDDGSYSLYYLALSDDGTIYIFLVYGEIVDGEADLDLRYGALGTLGVVPMSDDETAYSMVYTGYLADKDGFFLADNTTKSIYFVDLAADTLDAVFVGKIDGATNISTLFDNYFDAAGSLDATEAVKELARSVTLSSPMKAATVQLYTEPEAVPEKAEFIEEVPVEDALPEEEAVEDLSGEDMEVVDLADGGLNSFRGNTPAVRSTTVSARAGSDEPELAASADVSLNLAEEEDVHNGMYVLTYDPDGVVSVNVEAKTDFLSAHVDQEKGEITIAYASADLIKAGETVASVTFTPACDDSTVTVSTKERNRTYDLSESEEFALTGNGHKWGEPEWTWSGDYTAATAVFTCETNAEHTETVNAVITSEKADHNVIYTATVEFNGKTYTDVQKVFGRAAVILTGVSLSLEGQIAINFKASAPEEAVKAVIRYEKGDGIITEYPLDPAKGVYDATKNLYAYTISKKDVPAAEITVKACISFYDADGNQLKLERKNGTQIDGNELSYCAADWANSMIKNASADEKVKTLAKAILNYGGAAQEVFKTTFPAANPNGYLAEEMEAVVPNEAYDVVKPSNVSNTGYVGTSLVLNGAVEQRLYFSKQVTAAKDDKGNAYSVTKSGSRYYVTIPNIVAKELNKMNTVIVTIGGKNYTFKCCALSYANNQIRSTTADAALVKVCKALYLYNEAAVAYFKK